MEQKEIVRREEGEPRQVAFEVLVHLREERVAPFLGEAANFLRVDNVYQSGLKRFDAKGVSLNLKGGRALHVMEKLLEARGMKLVGLVWRKDTETLRDGRISNGKAILFQFGYGSSAIPEEQQSQWDALARKVFEENLWSVDYTAGQDKMGLFGPTPSRKVNGENNAFDPQRQIVLSGVQRTVEENGFRYSWGGKTVTQEY